MEWLIPVIIIGAAALIIIVIAVLLSNLITKMLFEEALLREEPAILKKLNLNLSGSSSGDIVYERTDEAAGTLEAAVKERIEIKSRDGVDLVGHWYPADDPKRVIVAVHGWRSRWSIDFFGISSFWHDNGCSVLYVEQRGQNASGGSNMGFGLLERFDVLDWLSWLNQNKKSDLPIYICGVSMGSATVLMASGMGIPENVHGIIADCGFTSARAIWEHIAEDNLHLSYKIRDKKIDKMCKKLTGYGSDEYSTLKAMESNTTPVLFIHGSSDTFVPISMTYENYLACKAPKRILVVPGAEHAVCCIVDKDGYKKALKEFFEEFDN